MWSTPDLKTALFRHSIGLTAIVAGDDIQELPFLLHYLGNGFIHFRGQRDLLSRHSRRPQPWEERTHVNDSSQLLWKYDLWPGDRRFGSLSSFNLSYLPFPAERCKMTLPDRIEVKLSI